MACASPCTCSQSFQCSDNADCSGMGTCLADGRYCACERGRVGDNCAAPAISLTPDTAVEVWLEDEHALKTVHVDGYGGSGNLYIHTVKHSYVLFDLTQLAGNLSSTESGGAYIYWTPGYYSRHGSWFGRRDCNRLIEVAPVQDTEAWSSVASMTMRQALDSFPISGTDQAGALNFDRHSGPCCWNTYDKCHPACDPRLDVTKLVLAATEGPRKIAFRMRGLPDDSYGGNCRATKDKIILELRGMTRIPPPPPPPPPTPPPTVTLTETITMVVYLRMTQAEFGDEKQQTFKEALAKAAGQGVRADHVFIDTIEATSTAVRRLLAQGIRVTVSVKAPNKETAAAIAANLNEEAIKRELEKAGLPLANVLVDDASFDGGGGGGGASGGGRGGEGMSSKVVGGIVSGVVLLLIGAVCCHFRKRIFPQRKPKQESPENPMHWRQPTTFYHATTEENALRIQDQGFIIPDGPGGLLGRGVYCTSTLKKAMDYLKSPYGGVILQLTVDLGKCIELVPDDPMMKTWQTQYDSAWAPFSAANPGDKGKEENCVKDPRRIKVVQALAGDTTALNRGGYAIINGKLCRV